MGSIASAGGGGLDLEPIRRRLADLSRAHTPADVADAMRAEGRLVTGCSWSSAKWKRLAGDPAILRASIREAGQGEVIGLPDREVVEKVMAELVPVMEIEGDPVETMVTRHPEALVVRDEEHESAVAAARGLLAATPRIGLAGADLDGPGISRSIAGVRETVRAIVEGTRND